MIDRNKNRKRNKSEELQLHSPQTPLVTGDKRARLSDNQVSTFKTTPRQGERKMGKKEKEDAEREMEMEKFRNHYRVATRNMKKKRDEGGRLWTSGGQQWGPHDQTEEDRAVADIEEIVVQEIQARLLTAGQDGGGGSGRGGGGGGGGWSAAPPVKTFNNKLNFHQSR